MYVSTRIAIFRGIVDFSMKPLLPLQQPLRQVRRQALLFHQALDHLVGGVLQQPTDDSQANNNGQVTRPQTDNVERITWLQSYQGQRTEPSPPYKSATVSHLEEPLNPRT